MRLLPPSLLALLGLMLSGATASQGDPSQAQPPSSSPAADGSEQELICHTDNPAECYPKIFQATDEFQIVKPDQDLPKGLHVRLNVQTGQKEAKINVPDEENPALAGLPVDSSIVIVEPEKQEDQPKIPKNAPAYDPIGKIKKPEKSPEDSASSSAFYKSLQILKKGLDVDSALEMLEDISHDIYYGLKITEDYETTKHLFCLANTPSIFEPAPHSASKQAEVHRLTLSRAKQAALTISSAVQNNPKALAEIEKHWPALQQEICARTGFDVGQPTEALGLATFRLVSPISESGGTNDPSVAKARISAISGLLKNKSLRKHFLANNGMELLLDILVIKPEDESSDEWEPAQRKAGILILDNFLDEDMGAAVGDWPSKTSPKQASDKDCASRTQISGECWDWHAKQLADRHRKNDKNHWSVELWDKLKEQRKKVGKKSSGGRKAKDEL